MDVIKIGKAAPVEVVVEQLRKILAAAERGQIRHITAIFMQADGSTVNLDKGEASEIEMLGHVMRLAHRLQKDMDDRVEDFDFDKQKDSE